MPRVKLFNEKEILEKAMNLFWKKGYYDTSIQDLVDDLGINRASLYDTYGGKRELFDKAFSYYRINNTEGVKKFLATGTDVKAGFKALFEMAIQQAITDKERKGCFVVNTTIELLPNEQGCVDTFNENRKVFEQMFYDYLMQGVKRNQLEPSKDYLSIATLFFTFYNGLRVITKTDFDPRDFSKSVDALLSVLD
ncbi:MAG: TetR/AcrR family transcriptional regulator [Bacteroidota bacterium]